MEPEGSLLYSQNVDGDNKNTNDVFLDFIKAFCNFTVSYDFVVRT